MEFESLFRHFWWLIFPIFGMFMGILAMITSTLRARQAMGLIKSYVDQGRDPPPELLKIASGEDAHGGRDSRSHGVGYSLSFVIFSAIALGFLVAYFKLPDPRASFAFLIVSVVMGVMALGYLLMALFPNRSGE